MNSEQIRLLTPPAENSPIHLARTDGASAEVRFAADRQDDRRSPLAGERPPGTECKNCTCS